MAVLFMGKRVELENWSDKDQEKSGTPVEIWTTLGATIGLFKEQTEMEEGPPANMLMVVGKPPILAALGEADESGTFKGTTEVPRDELRRLLHYLVDQMLDTAPDEVPVDLEVMAGVHAAKAIQIQPQDHKPQVKS